MRILIIMPTTLETHYFDSLVSAVRYLKDLGFTFWRKDAPKGSIYRNGLGFALLFPTETVNGNTCWAVDLPRKYH
jgi:hypothetical protein